MTLPEVGQQRGTWGEILLDFLREAHNEDGTLKSEVVDYIRDGLATEVALGALEDQVDAHGSDTDNPHETTADQVGLGNVDNTSDADKPVSTATEEAIAVVSSSLDARTLPAVLKTALDEGLVPVAVQILGDSTGNAVGEWVDLLANDLADAYPDFEVRHYVWDGTTIPPMPTTIQAAPSQSRHVPFTLANTSLGYSGESVTGDLDVRVKVEPTAWGSGTEQMLAAQFGGVGFRAWRFYLGGTGTIFMEWYNAGGSSVGTASSGAWTPPAGPVWVRTTVDVDNGAAGSDTKIYTSTDGTTWTQRGSTLTTAGATTINDVDYPYEVGARGGSASPLVGKLYEVHVRDGIDGPMAAPALPELWTLGTSTGPSPVGDPILTFVNGSQPGADFTYLNDTSRVAHMTPNYGQVLTYISSSHNEGFLHGTALRDEVEDYLSKVTARLPSVPILVLTQNPRVGVSTNQAAQGYRRIEYMSWATSLGYLVVDTYGAFLADPGGVASLVEVDGFHPNSAGSIVWKDAVKGALGIS